MGTSQVEIMRRQGDLPKAAQKLWISETFTSRQGEGRLTGTNSFFIRTSGCNLRCWFCDTPYASWQPAGNWLTVEQLVSDAIASRCEHVVLTGGEPLLPLAVVDLVRQLRGASLHVTIETAGTLFRDLAADLISISPKLASSAPYAFSVSEDLQASEPSQASGPGDSRFDPSFTTPQLASDRRWAQRHEAARWRPQVIQKLIANAVEHQLKFVVDSRSDFTATVAAVEELAVAAPSVWIMPQGIDERTLDEKARWLEPLCRDYGYHYCDRMHIRWYGNRRGT